MYKYLYQSSVCISTNKSKRCFSLSFLEFRKGNAPILVATDVASRGLGLSLLVLLVNQIYFIDITGTVYGTC